MTEEPIEQEARRLITGDRRADYGPVRDGFERAAGIWSEVRKLYRESMNHKRDNLVDLVGYTLLLDQLVEGVVTEPLSPTIEALCRPGVLRKVGGTLAEKLAEDAPLRDRYRRQRAGD